MKIKLSILSLVFITLGTSCQDRGIPIGSVPLDTRICLTIKHHEDIVEDTEVFLKLNAIDFPGYSGFAYDTLIAEDPNNGQVCVEGFVYGSYWAMSKGFDRNWGANGDDVQGAIFFDLDQFNPVIDTVLVVNEF